jgi:hypothetical protein
VTTQLRLVEPPASTKNPKKPSAGRARTRTAAVARSGRRSANWGEWHLDAGTRRVGRAGVAEARRALEAAIETAMKDGLSKAS